MSITVDFLCLSGLVFVVLSHVTVNCATLNDTNTLHTDLLLGYNANSRPVTNQDDPVTIAAGFGMTSIKTFDEVKETFEFIGTFLLNWYDDSMKWESAMYGGLTSINFKYQDVWVPELLLMNLADTAEVNVKTIRYNSNGLASWMPAGLYKATCEVNVWAYPFDRQVCTSSFVVWGYWTKEVYLNASSPELLMNYYTSNGFWTVEHTSVWTDTFTGVSRINFAIHLKRKAMYVIMNVCLPILFLSILNLFVFVLVPDSGERVSYSITVLLSIAVFLTVISNTLPKTSEPVSLISYTLMVEMVTSSLITLITILNLRLYNLDDEQEVPTWLQMVYRGVSKSFSGEKIFPRVKHINVQKTICSNVDSLPKKQDFLSNSSATEDVVGDMSEGKLEQSISECEEKTDVLKITWKKISYMIDGMALLTFAASTLINMLVFVILTSSEQ